MKTHGTLFFDKNSVYSGLSVPVLMTACGENVLDVTLISKVIGFLTFQAAFEKSEERATPSNRVCKNKPLRALLEQFWEGPGARQSWIFC